MKPLHLNCLPFIYKMMQPVKQMKVYLNVQRLGYAKMHKSKSFTDVVTSKKGSKDQESIQSSTTSDPGYHMGK